VARGVGPEFKDQYCKKKETKWSFGDYPGEFLQFDNQTGKFKQRV
jgi:hypothetical protein